MAILAKESGGGDFAPIPEATYLGRCVQVIDLGRQYSQAFGSVARKIMFGFEIIDDSLRYKNKEGDEVRPIIAIELTLSLSSKSSMRPFMESWFGKSFTPENLQGFDVTKAIGHPAMLAIVHNYSEAKGRTYANIKSAQKPVGGITVPPAEHPQVVYEIDMLTGGTWNQLADWIKKKIEGSVEFTAKIGSQPEDRSGKPLAAPAALTNKHPLAENPELVNDPKSEFYVEDEAAPF